METLKKIVKNQYFPAAAVLAAVVLFWVIAMFGGLSLLNNNQPPMATLTWLLFVYAAAVLTPLAGVVAAVNLVRRWQRNRQYAQALAEAGVSEEFEAGSESALPEQQEPVAEAPAEPAVGVEPEVQVEPEAVPEPNTEPAPVQPQQGQPASQSRPAAQPLKKPALAKQRKKAA
ncbi:hypothetical protein [Arthrobacter sp. HS15c]|uniref:hypothetical protein n=1 Tax=Arthrobacter sp. HS15c TaxID=3230279 RepID=UPI0034654B83